MIYDLQKLINNVDSTFAYYLFNLNLVSSSYARTLRPTSKEHLRTVISLRGHTMAFRSFRQQIYSLKREQLCICAVMSPSQTTRYILSAQLANII